MRLLAKWIIVALAFLALPSIINGISIASFTVALIVAVFWGFANLVVKPILTLVLLPINIITLGLFSFVINALLFWGIGYVVKGFYVEGFVPAFLGALLMSVVGALANFILRDRDE